MSFRIFTIQYHDYGSTFSSVQDLDNSAYKDLISFSFKLGRSIVGLIYFEIWPIDQVQLSNSFSPILLDWAHKLLLTKLDYSADIWPLGSAWELFSHQFWLILNGTIYGGLKNRGMLVFFSSILNDVRLKINQKQLRGNKWDQKTENSMNQIHTSSYWYCSKCSPYSK